MNKGLKIGLIILGTIIFLTVATRFGFYLQEGQIMDFPAFVICKGQGYSIGFHNGELEATCPNPQNQERERSPVLERVGKTLNYRRY